MFNNKKKITCEQPRNFAPRIFQEVRYTEFIRIVTRMGGHISMGDISRRDTAADSFPRNKSSSVIVPAGTVTRSRDCCYPRICSYPVSCPFPCTRRMEFCFICISIMKTVKNKDILQRKRQWIRDQQTKRQIAWRSTTRSTVNRPVWDTREWLIYILSSTTRKRTR